MRVMGSSKNGFVLSATSDEMKKILGIDPVEIRNERDYPIDKIWDMLDGVRKSRTNLIQAAQRLTNAASLLMREDPLFAEVTKNP